MAEEICRESALAQKAVQHPHKAHSAPELQLRGCLCSAMLVMSIVTSILCKEVWTEEQV